MKCNNYNNNTKILKKNKMNKILILISNYKQLSKISIN